MFLGTEQMLARYRRTDTLLVMTARLRLLLDPWQSGHVDTEQDRHAAAPV